MSSEIFSHGTGAKKNHRKHPGIKGVRPDHKALKRREAAERNAAYAALPLAEKMRRNPNRFLDVVEEVATHVR